MFLGLSSAVGRLLSGRLCDVKCINIQYVNQLAIAITGMATVLLPLARTFVSVAFYTVVFGFADGAFMTTQNVILLSIVGPERRATAFGFGNMLCAFAVASGPPLAGEWLPQGGLQGYREKSANTVVKYQQPHGFLLKRREMTGFEIQTKDICKPPLPPALRRPHWSVNVLSTKVLIEDTIVTSPFGDGTTFFTWSSMPCKGPVICSAKVVPSFLAYFDTLSIDPALGIEPTTSCSAIKHSTDWANPPEERAHNCI